MVGVDVVVEAVPAHLVGADELAGDGELLAGEGAQRLQVPLHLGGDVQRLGAPGDLQDVGELGGLAGWVVDASVTATGHPPSRTSRRWRGKRVGSAVPPPEIVWAGGRRVTACPRRCSTRPGRA